MPWSDERYPVSMKNLPPRVRQKAIEIANARVGDGLKPGERVVVYPSDALRDGSRIEAR